MPASFTPDVVQTDGDGVVRVNNVPYPMAEACIATEYDIQQSIRRTAKQIAQHYSTVTQIVHGSQHTVGWNGSPQQKYEDKQYLESEKAPISLENPLICLCVLKGSYVFTADMVRALNDEGLALVCDFIRISSYGSATRSTGQVKLMSTPKFTALKGKHLLILEDVLDSGYSMKWLLRYLHEMYAPASVKVCVLACKPKQEARKVDVPEPDYSCLHVPNKWVIGYGFEVNDRYRNFRHVFSLKEGEGKRFPAKL